MATMICDHVTKKFGDIVPFSDTALEVAVPETLISAHLLCCGKATASGFVESLEQPNTGLVFIPKELSND